MAFAVLFVGYRYGDHTTKQWQSAKSSYTEENSEGDLVERSQLALIPDTQFLGKSIGTPDDTKAQEILKGMGFDVLVYDSQYPSNSFVVGKQVCFTTPLRP